MNWVPAADCVGYSRLCYPSLYCLFFSGGGGGGGGREHTAGRTDLLFIHLMWDARLGFTPWGKYTHVYTCKCVCVCACSCSMGGKWHFNRWPFELVVTASFSPVAPMPLQSQRSHLRSPRLLGASGFTTGPETLQIYQGTWKTTWGNCLTSHEWSWEGSWSPRVEWPLAYSQNWSWRTSVVLSFVPLSPPPKKIKL